MTVSAANTLAMAVADRLTTISVDNGFFTDIGLKLFRGKRRLGEDDVPCVVLIEGQYSANGNSLRSVSVDQTYICEGVCACDPDNPNDAAHKMISDLKTAIFTGDPSFGRTVKRMDFISHAIAPREDGIPIVTASVEFRVTYVEDLLNP